MKNVFRSSAVGMFAVAALAVASLTVGAGVAHATTLYLSQNTLSLNVNQYSLITASPTNGMSVQVTSNTSPSVASAVLTGTTGQVQVQGLLGGSTNVTICTTDQSQCGVIYVVVAGGSSSTLNFSNSNPTVGAGQTTSISATNSQSTSVVISSNSNPSAVSATVNGSTSITITGTSYGSSTVVICASGTSQCGSLYVTVSGSSSNSSLSFSNSSPSVSIGQSTSVSVYSGSGSYTVSSNSNSSVASVSISGTVLSIYGTSTGSDNVTVCDTNGSAGCATLYITVGSGSGSGVTFSNSNPYLSVGGSTSVTLYNSSGSSFFLSSNSNPSAVSTSISGTVLTLYGLSTGTSTVAVCVSGVSQCGSLYVTVTNSTTNGSLTFSPSSPTLTIGQYTSVSVYGGTGTYTVSSNTNSSVASVSLSGSILTLYGISGGSSSVTVCTSSSGQCGTLYITVTGSTSTGSLTFSSTVPSVSSGQTMSDAIYGGGGSYYISINSSPTIISATISGTSLNMYGIATGTSNITVCSLSNTTQCGNVTAMVNGTTTSNGTVYFTTTSLPNASVGQSYSAQVGVGGGSAPYTYQVYSGMLPAGLSLGTTGYITGTPTTVGSVSFSVRASDASGNSAIENLTLAVQQASSIVVPVTTVNTPTALYHDGTLVSDHGTIYIIFSNTKTGFATKDAFLGLGYSFKNVIAGDTSSLTPSGSAIKSSTAAHPYGSWVSHKGTVYFVSSSGLVPVPSAAVFLGNNGKWALVVPANSADLQLPVQGAMSGSDSRVN